MSFKKIWHEFADFINLIKREHPNVIGVILLGALTTAAQPFVYLLFFSRILTKVLAGNYESCIIDVGVLLTVTLVLGLIAKACTQSVNVLKETCMDTVYQRTSNKAFIMEFEEFERTETMDAIRRIRMGENSTGGVDTQIQSIYVQAENMFSFFFSMVFVGMLFTRVQADSRNFFSSAWSSVAMITVFLSVMLVAVRISSVSSRKFYAVGKKNEHNNSLGQYGMTVMGNYQYGKDIRIYSMQALIEKYFTDIINAMNHFYLKWGVTDGCYTGCIMFLTQMASGFVYIVLGGKAIYGAIDAGEVFMYAGAVLQLTTSIRIIITEYNSFHYRAEYLNSYYDFINRPNTHYTGTLPVEKRDDAQYEFTLENVSFHYPGCEELILNHVNLKFQIGEKYAIVGRNGAGKTTLIKLLCRLYDPCEGRILLNGIDIRYYDYSEYSKVFSVVFQDFKLLSLPLADNIASGEAVDPERMRQVLKQLELEERVERMPAGLSTYLYKSNGNGVEISGGEAQKLAIARALYKDGPFIILDEPTAALDPISEAKIYENFNEMIQGKTAVYISHRMSSCKFCDDIIVLEKGSIAERGNHTELMAAGGIYASLYQAQAQHYVA